MKALRFFIAASWLLVMTMGSPGMAMPMMPTADAMPCHETPHSPKPVSDMPKGTTMPCCAHVLAAPVPTPAPTSRLFADRIDHRIEHHPQPLNLTPPLDPDPPRSA